MGKALRDQHWERVLPILDQGNLGSCTGNAGTGALGTQALYDASGKGVLPANLDAGAGETFAVQLYSDASVADRYRGKYPPGDTGSSGLAICRVLRSRGAIFRYRWTRSAQGLLQLLQAGLVLHGMPWYRAFFQPDASGFIDADPAWAGSGLAGGHEVESVGVQIDDRDAFNSVVIYANSWGTGRADSGFFRMRVRTYEQLHGVDLKQF